MPFQHEKLAIPDVVIVTPNVYSDQRGQFWEVFKNSDFQSFGIDVQVKQISQSRSRKNVLRGLHYQLNPKAQGKLVRVVAGEVFDVAVDIRPGSRHYGKWVGQVLSAREGRLLWIPEGFAHGYCALSEDAEMIYYCGEEWAPDLERGIRWNDPDIGIVWPVQTPIVASKDAAWPRMAQADNNFVYGK